MHPRVRNAIPRIEILQNGQPVGRGTGCLVAPGLVLTAYHVVGDRRADPPAPYPGVIQLTFPGHVTTARIAGELWDHRADWALLQCDTPPSAESVPLGDSCESGVTWETFGFPDANPRDGMVQTGTLENDRAELESNWVLQLYSKQAAAGTGAPVRGLSGAPLIVDNSVVGLMRFALMKDGGTVAGTLYACPVATVLTKTGDFLPVPDPCRGLPGLPRQPLPAAPFRYLDRFSESEAEIFFGRDREIRELYSRITSDEAALVTLLYGQSGVGKSSFLDAGVVPRLRWNHEVRYLRRSVQQSLTAAFLVATQRSNDSRTLVILFDQIEEVFTQPRAADPHELADFCRLLATLAPPTRVVLSFRKEWLPEIEKQLMEAGIDFGRLFLERFDRTAVEEVIAGLTRTSRLRERYRLGVDAELPPLVSGHLLEDPSSPISPTLQILLTKMWTHANETNPDSPRFTTELYTRLKREGLLLGDFLDQQMAKLRALHPQPVGSGFVLELLYAHTTAQMTSEQRKRSDLEAEFPKQSVELTALLEELKNLFLLSSAGGSVTRLTHDTLSPVVRARNVASLAPAQRARRLLEGRGEDWKSADGEVLSASELTLVTAGLGGMRAIQPHERRLLDASLSASRRRRRNVFLLRAAALAVVVMTAAALGVFWQLSRDLRRERDLVGLRQSAGQAGNWYDSEPPTGLTVAVQGVANSLAVEGDVINEVEKALYDGVVRALEKNWWYADGAPRAAVVSAESRIAAVSDKGTLEIWDIRGNRLAGPISAHQGGASAAAYSPDGQTLVTGGDDGSLRLWDRHGNALGAASHSTAIRSIVFLPGGAAFASGDRAGVIRLWTFDGQVRMRAELRFAQELFALSAAPTEGGAVLVAAGAERTIARWDQRSVEPWSYVRRPFPPRAFDGLGDPVQSVAVKSAGGRLLIATGDAEANVRVWSGDGATFGKPYSGHSRPVVSVVFDSNGDALISGSGDGLHFSSVAGEEIAPAYRNFDAGVASARLQPGGEHVVVASPDGTISLVDYATIGAQIGEPLRAPVPSKFLALAWNPRARIVATGDDRGRVHLWSRDSRGLVQTLHPHSSAIRALAFDSTGALMASGADDGSIVLGGSPLGTHRQRVTDLRFSPDGSELMSSGADGELRLWSVKERKPLRVLYSSGGPAIVAAALTGDGLRFACATAAGKIIAGEINASSVSTVDANASAVAFSADGKRLLTGSGAGYIEQWFLDGKSAGPWLKAHTGPVRRLIARGDHVYSSAADGVVAVNGRELNLLSGIHLKGHTGPVHGLDVLVDGSLAVSAGEDGTVRFWRADWPSWLELACSRLREHPVFRFPLAYQFVIADIEKTRAFCADQVWKVDPKSLPPLSQATAVPRW